MQYNITLAVGAHGVNSSVNVHSVHCSRTCTGLHVLLSQCIRSVDRLVSGIEKLQLVE